MKIKELKAKLIKGYVDETFCKLVKCPWLEEGWCLSISEDANGSRTYLCRNDYEIEDKNTLCIYLSTNGKVVTPDESNIKVISALAKHLLLLSLYKKKKEEKARS